MHSNDVIYPSFISGTKLFDQLLKSECTELHQLEDMIQGLTKEITPSLTEKWVIDWENILGLPSLDQETLDIRHSKIISKLRSSGTFTEKRVKEIAWSFKNGEVSITQDVSKHLVTIKFTSEKGVPPNYKDFEQTINQVKPAHLQVKYEFTYNTRDELTTFTRDELSRFTLKQIREVDVKELRKKLTEGVSDV